MILEYEGKLPVINEKTYIADNAVVTGDTSIGRESSVWFGAVLRGDDAPIEIGERTNIQDNVTVHSGIGFPTKLGNNVTIGHNAIIHGCTIDDNVIVGMGAIVMNGAHIGSNSIIGAGALVREKADIPEGSIVVGAPAKIIKETSEPQLKSIADNAQQYVHLAGVYGKWGK